MKVDRPHGSPPTCSSLESDKDRRQPNCPPRRSAAGIEGALTLASTEAEIVVSA